MPDIGETLRETRMRRRIDMTEVEAATKIRAKYLRALENEEWDALPGPTFVKSFLRTYAEYLDLDSRLLVEEYRQRFERAPSTQELTPFGPGMNARGRRRRPPRAPIGPAVAVVLGIVVLLVALYVLGTWGNGSEEPAPPPATETPLAGASPTATATPRKKSSKAKSRKRSKKHTVPTRATLRLTASSSVWVCLVDATGKRVLDGRVLAGGESTSTFRSQRFRGNFGNGALRFRINGKSYSIPPSSNPVGYEFRPGRAPIQLSDAARASLCA